MSGPDVSHSYSDMTHYTTQEDSEDPGSLFKFYATGKVSIRHRLLI
jgi:hypothetical protein